MAFTGKATYDAGPGLPEIAEDVGDLVGILGAHETPLLAHLGDARRTARSTVHEWLEDELLPNTDEVTQASWGNPSSDTFFDVANPSRFREGDLVRPEGSSEVMRVQAVVAPGLGVVRGYGGTTPEDLATGQSLHILGNPALEGADAGGSRTTSRVRRRNYLQIFSATVEVSGSQQAVETIGVRDELDYQLQERLRELMRDLENCVINGVASSSSPEGSGSVARTMNGIVPLLTTNRFAPGEGPIPPGDGAGSDGLTEEVLNAALRAVWERSSSSVDTIVVGGRQKRRINRFVGDSRAYGPADEAYRDLVGVYESDFGVCRVVLSRWVPMDSVLLLDSSRVSVLPLTGRSFQFRRLATRGDSESGQVLGEYTLELMNEGAHGVIGGLSAA